MQYIWLMLNSSGQPGCVLETLRAVFLSISSTRSNNLSLLGILPQAANDYLEFNWYCFLASTFSLCIVFLIGSINKFAIQHILSLLYFPLLWAHQAFALLHNYFNYFLIHFTYSECSLNCVSLVQIWAEFVRFALHHELKIWIWVSRRVFGDLCASIWVTEPCSAALVWINHLNYSIMRALSLFFFFPDAFWQLVLEKKKINNLHNVEEMINGSL